MGIIGKIINYFKSPKHETTAYGPVYAAVIARLKRDGVTVGSTASFPRVEVYGWTEQSRLDKDGRIRQMSCTVESISNKSMADAVAMHEDNMKLLTETALEVDNWTVLGVLPDAFQDGIESSDTNKIIYRCIQSYNIWAERVTE